MVAPLIVAAAPLAEAGVALAARSALPAAARIALPAGQAVAAGVEAVGMTALRSGGLIGRIAGWMGAGNSAIAQGGIFSRVAGSLFGRNAAVTTGEMVGTATEAAATVARTGGGFLQGAGRWFAGGMGIGAGGVAVMLEKVATAAKNHWVLSAAAILGGIYLARDWLFPSRSPVAAAPSPLPAATISTFGDYQPSHESLFPAAQISGRGVQAVSHDGMLVGGPSVELRR